ncbi:predicted protein [Histoplasma mississippiense (nom. inval.)]|uniref:predicted protein n=1 Tax=Ajellomyces capsulatus (strain NAm1 / WU24) TaxID=2059318 RepID=UPI000157B76E|nr:predicted protein [Histoplasma mississippiense (nom. inval.)]EDN03676.1 predicted protein [Histoplasma mississippiense (nom. inval.)]
MDRKGFVAVEVGQFAVSITGPGTEPQIRASIVETSMLPLDLQRIESCLVKDGRGKRQRENARRENGGTTKRSIGELNCIEGEKLVQGQART